MDKLNKNELQVLINEYNQLHDNRRMWDNNIFKLFVLLLTISAIIIGAVLEHKLFTADLKSGTNNSISAWDALILAYPYVTYLFTFIFLILSGAVINNSTALTIIEDKINALLDKKTLFWENVIVKDCFYKQGSTLFYGTLAICLFFVVLDITCISISLKILSGTIYQTGYIFLNITSIVVILTILIYHMAFEKHKIREKVTRYMDNKNDSN